MASAGSMALRGSVTSTVSATCYWAVGNDTLSWSANVTGRVGGLIEMGELVARLAWTSPAPAQGVSLWLAGVRQAVPYVRDNRRHSS